MAAMESCSSMQNGHQYDLNSRVTSLTVSYLSLLQHSAWIRSMQHSRHVCRWRNQPRRLCPPDASWTGLVQHGFSGMLVKKYGGVICKAYKREKNKQTNGLHFVSSATADWI